MICLRRKFVKRKICQEDKVRNKQIGKVNQTEEEKKNKETVLMGWKGHDRRRKDGGRLLSHFNFELC